MATKQIGLGTIVKVDDDDSGSTFTTVTVLVDATPPPRNRVRVDVTALDDTLATDEMGIEDKSDFVFTQYWHPGDTNHQIVDTLFGSKAEVLWQVVYPFTVAVTDQFNGKVAGLVPSQITTNGTIQRQVTIHRTGAITRT
jgi:hypothetical protein